MVNNKIAQRAVAAGLSGLMTFGAAAPAALAYTNYGNFRLVSTSSNNDSDHWKRLSGSDRYGTMKEIVKAYNELNENLWVSLRKGTSNKDVYTYHSTVVLASGDNWPDALAANGLAGYLTNVGITDNFGSNDSVPVLITKSGSLTAETKDLLKGMQVQNCIIMGGTAAISQDVEDAINKMGIGTSRVAGKDRQDTSVKAMRRINGNWDRLDKNYDLIIASGNNYADALSISPYAYRMGTPIILTDKDGKLTDEEVAAIRDNDKIREIVIVGGTEAVKDDVLGQIGTIKNNRTGINVVRVAGADRYETSAKIAEFEIADWSRYARFAGFSFDHAIVATGENFPDALLGGQLAGGLGSLIDVKDFSAADLNAWTPCPLLLTKEGDTRAENIIAQGLNRRWSTTTVGTSTYESFGSWVNTWTGWYDATTTTTKEWQDLFKSWYANGDAKGFWISDAAIDGSDSTVAVEPIPEAQGNAVYSFRISQVEGGTAAQVSNVFVAGENAQAVGLSGIAANIVYTPATYNANGSLATEGTLWFNYLDAVSNTMHRATVKVTDRTENDNLNKIVNPAAGSAHVDTTVSISDRAGTYQVFSNNANPINTVVGTWRSDIVAYIEDDNDFYGIILGGTSAISNKKRDDLEDVVKRVARTSDIVTVGDGTRGTISVVTDGVRRNYRPLVRVAGQYNFRGVAPAGQDWSNFYGHVYEVYGTASHVVAIFDAAGNFQDWRYYYGGNNANLKADWGI